MTAEGDQARPSQTRSTLAAELGPTLRLAGPVVLAEVGWMMMGVVDVVMVGLLGAEAIGAAGIGNVLCFTVAIFGVGMLLGLDTLVSQAFGAGRVDDCHRSLAHGIYLSLVLTTPLMLIVNWGTGRLGSWGIAPEIVRGTASYAGALNWGTLPLLLYAALRRYLQGMGLVLPVMFALISANLINVVVNWALISGHLGMPALGVEGSGWATSLARVYMVVVLAVAVVWHDRRLGSGFSRDSWRLEPGRIRRLLALGFPSAVQHTLEVGVFAVAAVMAGWLGSNPLAAHEITLHVSALTFMVPLGVSSAAAVRVGHAIGRGDPEGAARAGWSALLVGSGFMLLPMLMFLTVPRSILGLFTTDAAVISIGVTLLGAAAVFQLFDGLQVVATGALRGAGETRRPMLCNLVAHWALGLPIGYVLAFHRGWRILGIWIGLTTGLIAAGLILLVVWRFKARTLSLDPGSTPDDANQARPGAIGRTRPVTSSR